MELLKSVTSKIVTGVMALVVVIAAISWWQMSPETRNELLFNTGRIVIWIGIVLAAPWASIPIIGRVARLESNFAGGVLVVAYSLIETVVLAWLLHWKIAGSTAWTFLVLGGLLAGVYNLLVCDWIAEKFE